MTSSGTVGTTTIDTAKVLEHALRRCKIKPGLQTPEVVETARESLFLLLTSLSARGLNLWCVDKVLVGLTAAQATYVLPTGTLDVMNVVYSQPTPVVGTTSSGVNSLTSTLTETAIVVRIGVKCSAVTATSTLTLEAYDGSWSTLSTTAKTDWEPDTWYWFDIDPSATGTAFRATFNAAATVSDICLATAVRDLPMSQLNRDTWASMPNKTAPGRPSVNYFLEKKLTPQLTLWPVPSTDADCLLLYAHRQPQDVGTLTQTLEIPVRWYNPFIWQLAALLCFELDMVDAAVIPIVTQMAEKSVIEAERSETDGSSMFIQPNIGVYTR
jgi:hypothetical protein